MTTPNVPAKRNAFDELPESLQHAIRVRELDAAAIRELYKATPWGGLVDAATMKSMAEWGRRNRVDIMHEVDVLANGRVLYLKAAYFIRRLAELRDRGDIEYVTMDHVEADPRLIAIVEGKGPQLSKDMIEWARTEWERRLRLRLTHKIPEAALGAVVFTIKHKGLSEPLAAANWCPRNDKDPVGAADAEKTAETRAARRAIKFLAPYLPSFASDVDQIEKEAEAIAISIRTDVDREKGKMLPPGPAKLIGAAYGGDPYVTPAPDSLAALDDKELLKPTGAPHKDEEAL